MSEKTTEAAGRTSVLPPDLLRIRDAAALLEIRPDTLRRRILDRTLTAYRIGGILKIRRADVLALVERIN